MQGNSTTPTDLFFRACKACKVAKTLEEFSEYDNGHGTRLRARCRQCRNEYQQQIRANDNTAPARPAITEKACLDCKVIKPIEAFAWQNSSLNQRRYRGSICRPCRAERTRIWLTLPGNAKRSRLRQYGLSLEDYQRLLAAQEGMCACCRQPETAIHAKTGKVRDLSVDHDHESGAVRGLLCAGCNNGLGCFKDDPARLQAAISYLGRLAIAYGSIRPYEG